jgi:hypothetical protein
MGDLRVPLPVDKLEDVTCWGVCIRGSACGIVVLEEGPGGTLFGWEVAASGC